MRDSRTIALLVVMLLVAAVRLDAKVASVGLVAVTVKEGTPYTPRDHASVETTPLTMASLRGNPMVWYKLYLAHGAETDLTKFDSVSMTGTRFSGAEMSGGQVFTWRLDSNGRGAPFFKALRPLPPGTYSAYVTADDGDGPSPPSNILTFELMPWPDEIVAPPAIASAHSPAAGIVVLRISPVDRLRDIGIEPSISIHRADGRTEDSAAFKGLGSRIAPTRYFEDTEGFTRTGTLEVIVTGLKSGTTSFVARAQLERGAWARSVSGPVVTIDVAGTSPRDEFPDITFVPLETSSVVESRSRRSLHPYPNPATTSITLRSPRDGAVDVTIVDHLGRRVGGGAIEFIEGVATIEVGGLAVGAYVAVVGGEVQRFLVAR